MNCAAQRIAIEWVIVALRSEQSNRMVLLESARMSSIYGVEDNEKTRWVEFQLSSQQWCFSNNFAIDFMSGTRRMSQ